MVDATYRTDLRELNDLNFARFDAKLEQRLASLATEFRAEMRAGFAELETRLTKRLFAFWIAQAAATAGLVFAVVKLAH